MKLAKLVFAVTVGSLAAHLMLKYRTRARLPEGWGSFGPDPLEPDTPQQPSIDPVSGAPR